MLKKTREEQPIAVACDFGVVYSLVLRAGQGDGSPRVILKVTWEDEESPNGETKSAVFELDLTRNRLIALGRKNNSLPAERFPAKWFCDWARREITPEALKTPEA
ncbi:MAG TPA: hypothetical protein VEJ63_20130 [Planctomycetota bacterium]|nr:hypothetical protein [Planctomycetota bacterium]